MSFVEIVEQVVSVLVKNWLSILGGVVFFFLGRIVGRVRAAREWKAKEFYGRFMVSLNSLGKTEDGQSILQIRTLLEKSIGDVFLNAMAIKSVQDAAALTTEANPLLPVPKEDRWFLLNAVLNEVAERFAAGTLAKDLGLPVVSHRYLIALTNEVAGSIRTHKVRAMVVRKDLLLSGAFADKVVLESEHHSTRLLTLAKLRAAYEATPDFFIDMELALPA